MPTKPKKRTIKPLPRSHCLDERLQFTTKRHTDGAVGEERVTFDTGATRCAGVAGDAGEFPLRYDLLLDNITALKRVARTYGEGSLKYPARNWMKGMPESSLLNHAMAHLVMHMEGDKSEDHLAHCSWNLLTLMHMQDNRPDMMDVTGPKENEIDKLKRLLKG